MDLKGREIVFTNDNCIGCNKCINACSAIGACISREEEGRARIVVDGTKCVACGSCIDVCVHGAREFSDDTDAFLSDLEKGKPISLLLAPAFKANHPGEYEQVLGGLKKLGANRIISVSFGADITTWGYLNYIRKYSFQGGISQPCPAVVSYIERYLPELLPKLFPVQSPLMCAAIYARKEMGITDSLAFISPCIAKKLEIEDPHNQGLVQYNVTFEHLVSYMKKHGLLAEGVRSEVEYGLGAYYPTPGGLAETVRWFLGDQVFIRQVEGERHLYEWLHQNKDRIRDGKTPFLFIDALNCAKGCICGTAVDPERSRTDDALYALLKIREEVKKDQEGSPWSRNDPPEERLKAYNEIFAGLCLEDYLRGYTDRSAQCAYAVPGEAELDRIFLSMNKVTKESREINCTCCGYESCAQMALAIHNGFNHRENCIYYEKTMVRELAVEKEMAEASTRAKSMFLANMSHEIRTPINTVLGMNEMILRECADEKVLSYAANIMNAGKSLLGLVNDILDFSKIEAGKVEILPVEYGLSSMINDLVNMVQKRADDKGLILRVNVDKNTPALLCGDEIRIKQVITNLLTNAVKFTERGGVIFGVTFDRDPADPESVILHVAVEDTGIGIKPEEMDRLFLRFERMEEGRNRHIEGTGLGMTISKNLLELMGSTLQVQSDYGFGSLFSFDLKQKVVKWEGIGNFAASYGRFLHARKAYREKFTAPGARVLVVDDHPLNLTVFNNLLKRTKVKIDNASNGDDALSMTMENRYDILFLDHMMPGKDGVETLHELKETPDNPNRHVPAVCVTANAVSGAREFYLKEGFDDYLTKPIESERLEELMLQYLPPEKVYISEGEKRCIKEEKKEQETLKVQLQVLRDSGEFDVEYGIRNNGTPEFYLTTITTIQSTLQEKLVELEDLYYKADMELYTIRVHTMKSSLRLVGCMGPGEEAQKLENAAKEGNIDYIHLNHPGFIRALLQVGDIMKEAAFKEEESAKPLIDEATLQHACAELEIAADEMDCDRLEQIMDELAGYAFPEEEKEFFRKVKRAVEGYDYDAVMELLLERS